MDVNDDEPTEYWCPSCKRYVRASTVYLVPRSVPPVRNHRFRYWDSAEGRAVEYCHTVCLDQPPEMAS